MTQTTLTRRQTLGSIGAALVAPALMPHAARAADAPSRAALIDDIRIVREALKMHPGLYRYNSPAAIEARLNALGPAFADAPDLETRYLILSHFLATIRCGHSYCNFFNQKRAVAAALFDRPTRLPFHFRWIDGAMVVTGEGGDALPPGTRVTRINGVTSRTMLKRLMPYTRADGGNDGKRVSLLEVRGDDSIEFFDVFHGLVFGAPNGGVFRIDATLPDGRDVQRTLPALTLAQRRAQMPVDTGSKDGPIWDWTMRPDGIAVLTMPGWALYNSKWDWESWLNARLDSLGGAKGLIIDLRDNEGGNQCGDLIFARLADKDLPFPPTIEKIRFRKTDPAIDAYLDTWDDSFRTLGVNARDLGGGFYSSPNDGDTAVITPRGPRVTVPVAALIGPVNSSATFSFAFRAKTTGIVRLFGETSGGNRRGINGGRFFFVRLPASNIEFDVPLIGYFRLTPEPDAGVEPDVRIAATAADIAAGRDPVLAGAAAWLNSL